MRKILTSIGLFYIILPCYQVVEYLQMDEHTIYKLARSEIIPSIKIAGQWRFKKEIIDR
ncbi:MAG: DNA-binding protein [Candidatus Neomarinimicrobiota bacterium]|nr:MAG: DNA-binding protein [Candidatus Neomarinimicrobiota bacterium]